MADVFCPSTASGYTKIRCQPVAVTTSLIDVIDARDSDDNSYDIINMEMFDLYNLVLKNEGAAALDNVVVEHSTDAKTWYAADLGTPGFFDSLPAGEERSLENIDNARSYLRIQTKTASGSTSVRVVIEGRVLVG